MSNAPGPPRPLPSLAERLYIVEQRLDRLMRHSIRLHLGLSTSGPTVQTVPISTGTTPLGLRARLRHALKSRSSPRWGWAKPLLQWVVEKSLGQLLPWLVPFAMAAWALGVERLHAFGIWLTGVWHWLGI
jgi:hypothetical protein